MIRDWIEILRCDSLFQRERYDDDDVGTDESFTFHREYMENSPMYVHIDEFYTCKENDEDISFINITGMESDDTLDKADQITLLWTGSGSNDLHKFNFDETVGVNIPSGVPASSIFWDKVQPQDPATGHFYAYNPLLHRDSFPAVIVIGGLRRYKNHNGFHGGNGGAICADYVGALWFQDGNRRRVNGPSSVLIEGYREFYINGRYCGSRFAHLSEDWDTEAPQIEFTTHPLSNRYFGDPQDEMFCMAQLGS